MIWLLLACSPQDPSTNSPPPGTTMPETVSDPRAYVIAGWAAHERNWLGVAYVNPTDPALVDPILDKELKYYRPFKGTLPSDPAQLDKFIKQTQVKYDTAIRKSDAGKAHIEKRLRERFENPEVSLDGDVATASMGYAPGTLVRDLRSGLRIQTDPTVLDRGELASEHVVRGFRAAHAAYPDAQTWRVTVEIVANGQHARYAFSYTLGQDRLFLKADSRSYIGSQDLGGVEGLLAGGYATYALDLADASSELRLLKPR